MFIIDFLNDLGNSFADRLLYSLRVMSIAQWAVMTILILFVGLMLMRGRSWQ